MGSAPRLKLDGGIPNRLADAAAAAGALERDGFDGGWTAETNHDPFLPLLLAAEHTSRLELGTNIAVAFARNPMIVANIGWDLQAYSQGRFNLGLGTQIRPHIEKRFSMPWSHPARRMREFVSALHAIWSRVAGRHQASVRGRVLHAQDHDADVHPRAATLFGAARIFIAAVGEAMTEMCGEVADGHLGHPMVSKRYLDEVTMPALLRGMQRSGRSRDDFEVSAEVMVATGENDAELAVAIGRRPKADRVLRIHAGLPQGARAARLGRPADRTAPPVPATASGTPWAR